MDLINIKNCTSVSTENCGTDTSKCLTFDRTDELGKNCKNFLSDKHNEVLKAINDFCKDNRSLPRCAGWTPDFYEKNKINDNSKYYIIGIVVFIVIVLLFLYRKE